MMFDRDAALAMIFPGNSEMARCMREHDWRSTPLGDPLDWPEGLKIPLRMLLTSRFEMWLGWGPDLQFFYNDAYISTLGIKHPVMLGKPFREVWGEIYHELADQVEIVRRGEATWNSAMMLLLERSGYPEETYHSFSYSPLYGTGGNVEGLLCIVTEETERIITERRIDILRQLGTALVGVKNRESVRRAVRSVFSANRKEFPFTLVYLPGEEGDSFNYTADAGNLLDIAWPEAELSPNEIKFFPLPPEGHYPAGAWKIQPREAMIVPIAGLNANEASGYLVLGCNPHRRNDADIEDFARLLAGQISGALATVEALEAAHRRADQIWQHSRDLMVVSDEAGTLSSVSPAWTRILGHEAEEVIGHNISQFVVPEDAAATLTALAEAGTGNLTGFENRLCAKTGGIRWISWHTARENGLVYGYGRDVTEQKASIDALTAAEGALRQAQKMEAVGQLTGGIAHDFNNLLTGITASLEMMQRRLASGRTENLIKYIAPAITSANRAAALTQRLLAFSRRQSLILKVVDLEQLVLGMEELVRRSIGEMITLRLEANEAPWAVKCDVNQLENAILNLAINARDAMPDGGTLTIRNGHIVVDDALAARYPTAMPGEYVTISVCDTGGGIPPDVISRVFEPFFTTKPLGQGTGLGLSMIYGFIRQSGGFVTIESEMGQGTCVHLHLPRSMDTAPIETAAGHPAESKTPHTHGTVLVVEDEPAVRNLILDLLNELGHSALEAEDGPAGLELLQSDKHIDVLITDVGLPGLNGRQLADAGLALRPNLKILFLTGYAHDASGSSFLEPGMEVITKPFTLQALATRIRLLTNRP